jgi:hypothetical protein
MAIPDPQSVSNPSRDVSGCAGDSQRWTAKMEKVFCDITPE